MTAISIQHYITFVVLISLSSVFAQNTAGNSGWATSLYPDPRTDYVKCGSESPGFLCDPDGLLSTDEKIALRQHVADIEQQSRKVLNKSPFCPTGAPDGLLFYILLMNKIDGNGADVGQKETGAFAYQLKEKYDIVKDVKTCDTTIVIVLTKRDGQLYTVAGRDVELTGEKLVTIYDRSRSHFIGGKIASGLTEYISKLASEYNDAQGAITTVITTSIPIHIIEESSSTTSTEAISSISSPGPDTNNPGATTTAASEQIATTDLGSFSSSGAGATSTTVGTSSMTSLLADSRTVRVAPVVYTGQAAVVAQAPPADIVDIDPLWVKVGTDGNGQGSANLGSKWNILGQGLNLGSDINSAGYSSRNSFNAGPFTSALNWGIGRR